ncbi:MAG: FHA domain-containing protein [Phycisphaeraceae bacterium]|nr:FHA domain-containing protein [Phycisphaeraceae bacterium]MCW5754100.1 FHA domain-containing protein [Phycisphaeraceae bacterium]
MLILTVLQGPDRGRKFELPANEPQLIGRSSEALPMTDNTVSRRHAELTPDAGLWFIRDLSSQNGTYVNGHRIESRVALKPGDQIRVGSTLFVFGNADPNDPSVVRVLRPDQIEAEFEHTLASNEDSIVLAEPEPAAAAVHHLKVIYRLTTLTAQAFDRRTLLAAVMELVFSEFRPERGCVMLYADGSDKLEPAVVKYHQPPRDPNEARIHVSRTILQHCLRHGEGVICTNAMTDPRFQAGDSVQRLHIRSAICAPIRHRDRTFGAIYIDSSISNYTFTQEQLALMNAIGQHTGLALANAELTTQKIHAERLAAMGETVASLSHSIKNILQGLRGGADVVEMGLKKSDLAVANGGWSILKRNLDRIVNLTLNMLTFSRQRQVEIELCQLNALVEECAQLLQGAAVTKQVALILDLDPEMPPIPLDPNLMHQALVNLVTNAVEAVDSDRGAVTIRTQYQVPDPLLGQQPPYAEIFIIDNGPGIPADRQRWIFEPFHTTKGNKGTGLGLAVTKRIIEEHCGRISVESSEKRGCAFRIVLPADASDVIDPSATATSRAHDHEVLGDPAG